jgi:hypothetical protein
MNTVINGNMELKTAQLTCSCRMRAFVKIILEIEEETLGIEELQE